MKIESGALRLKGLFGEYLKRSRLEQDWSIYDVAYMVDANHASVNYWETGYCFPASIVRLKKLALLYKGLPYRLINISREYVENLGKIKWDRFLCKLDDGIFVPPIKEELRCCYAPVDRRDKTYKKAFGRYLREERLNAQIGGSALARALGVGSSNYFQWESGTNFPQEMTVLALLDKLYGNTFHMLFGLCKENGIHLSEREEKGVLKRKERFAYTVRWDRNKPQPPSWVRYCENRR